MRELGIPKGTVTAISKNQYGTSGLPVRAPLALRIQRWERVHRLKREGKTLEQIAASEQISKERVRQILSGPMPKMPGRPLPRS